MQTVFSGRNSGWPRGFQEHEEEIQWYTVRSSLPLFKTVNYQNAGNLRSLFYSGIVMSKRPAQGIYLSHSSHRWNTGGTEFIWPGNQASLEDGKGRDRNADLR